MHHPGVALQAYTSDVYPRIPVSFAGAFLRWAPYDPNSKVMDVQPLLHSACAIHGLVGTNRENSILAVKLLAARGADIDSRYNGMTTLHEAILYSISDQSPELVRVLLELGANPGLRISRPGKPGDGLTAIEYAEVLARKHPAELRPVIALLRGVAI